MGKKKNLFLAFTPYQCIIASCIALEQKDKLSDLVIIQNFNFDNQFLENLRKVFNNVYVISEKERNRGSYFRRFYNRELYFRQLKKLLTQLLNKQYDYIYSSSESYITNQYFITKLKNENNVYYHFEDGSFEYSSLREKINETFKEKLTRIRWEKSLGFKRKIFSYPAESCIVSGIFLLFPKDVREELKDKKVYQITKDAFVKSINLLYPYEYSFNADIIVCLDLGVDSHVISRNQLIVDLLARYGVNISIKYHPREPKENYYIRGIYNVIESSIAFEGMYKDFKGILISNMSSILHTERFMCPTSIVICTGKLNNHPIKDEAYLKMLCRKGVLLPNSEQELMDILDHKINKR